MLGEAERRQLEVEKPHVSHLRWGWHQEEVTGLLDPLTQSTDACPPPVTW